MSAVTHHTASGDWSQVPTANLSFSLQNLGNSDVLLHVGQAAPNNASKPFVLLARAPLATFVIDDGDVVYVKRSPIAAGDVVIAKWE